MRASRWLTITAVFLPLALPAWAAELQGRVLGVTDGGTLILLKSDRRQVRGLASRKPHIEVSGEALDQRSSVRLKVRPIQ
jgi:hypothetical protein